MKKFIAAFLVVLICVAFSVAVLAAESKASKFGDTDLNGIVNVKDATLIQKHLAGITAMSDEGYALADVDGSGGVNIKDATLVQKFVAGMVTDFPANKGDVDDPTEVSSESASEQTPTAPSSTEAEIETSAPVTETEPSTQAPSKPSVDSDGYFDHIIRP